MPGCASSARRKKKMESAANRRLFWTTAGAVVAADLVTKLLAESLLARHLPVQVIGEYVQLRLVYNQCARRSRTYSPIDRKSTRLNSSHSQISYAVFCLKKKNIHYTCSQLLF